MMTLEEAIIHCKEKACDNTQCALEHRQLAEWLEELQQYRKKCKKGEIDMTQEEKFVGDHETFAEHYGCLPDPPQEPTPVIVGATSYESLSRILAIGFMDYLDRNRTEGKMCLSNAECDDIMKAFQKQDWERIKRYSDKYLLSKKRLDMTQEELDSKIEEVFLENKIGIPESLSYGAFRRIALHFYQMCMDEYKKTQKNENNV